MPKDRKTEYPIPTPSLVKRTSSILVKGYNTCLTNDSAVSLFIFSDSEEAQQEAMCKIASEIENQLGPVEINTFERNDAQSSEKNRKDPGFWDRFNPFC